MPFKDPEKARQYAKANYEKIKNDPIKLTNRRERQKLWMREWRKKHLERARQLCRESAKRNYNREERSAYIKEWKKNHPYNYEKYRKQANELDRKKRLYIIKILGGKCMQCGIEEIKVLQLHHIDGRKKGESKKFWRVPSLDISKFKLLCANCHTLEHWRSDYE
jgi:predicted HNH restriction endonuclease